MRKVVQAPKKTQGFAKTSDHFVCIGGGIVNSVCEGPAALPDIESQKEFL